MNRYILILILFFGYILNSKAWHSIKQPTKDTQQHCNCGLQLQYVKDYIEANNPAFQKIATHKKQFNLYKAKRDLLLQKSRQISDTADCLLLLKEYVSLIKDHHTNIYRIKRTAAVPAAHKKDTLSYGYKKLSDSINYVRISSFSGSLETELNVFYDSIGERLKSAPYLVLDLRDNGGGNDACYYGLMKYMYTQPIKVDHVAVWVSSENLKLYAKLYPNNTPLLEKMNAAKNNSFVYISKNQFWKMDSVFMRPRQVFILQNAGVASSAEDLVLYAKQSSKVTTLGSNTGGYTGYGNVMSVKTPNEIFQLQTTTTRYKKGSKYEFVGIPPDVYLSDTMQWEIAVYQLIEKSKKK